MRKITLLLCIFANSLVAQTRIIEPVFRKLTSSQANYKIVEIIDARFDKSNIGIVIDTTAQRIDTLMFEKPLQVTLLNYFGTCLETSAKPMSVILKINHFEINQRQVKDKEATLVCADFEAILKEDDQYRLIVKDVYCLEGVSKQKFDLNIPNTHYEFWHDVLKTISKKLKTDIGLLKPIMTEKIQREYKPSAILTEDSLRIGAYFTISDFKKNRPNITDIQVKQSNTGMPILYIKNTKKNTYEKVEPIDQIWGFCDGEMTYKNYLNEGNYYPIEPLGTSFEFSGFAIKAHDYMGRKGSAKNAQNPVKTALIGAKIGLGLGIAAYQLTSPKPFSVQYFPTALLPVGFLLNVIISEVSKSIGFPRFYYQPSSNDFVPMETPNIDYWTNTK